MTWTTPRTWVAGEPLTAAQLNEQVRDNLSVFAPMMTAWSAYTPTLGGGWVLGNGSLAGAYFQIGKLVFFNILYQVGSTDTKSGVLSFLLPTPAKSVFSMPVGVAFLADDSSSARASRTAASVGGNTIRIRGGTSTADDVSATVPWTWATNDTIEVNGNYEAA